MAMTPVENPTTQQEPNYNRGLEHGGTRTRRTESLPAMLVC